MKLYVANFAQMLKIREPRLLDREDGHWYRTKFGKVYRRKYILSATASDEKKNSLKSWKENEPAHEYITAQSQDIGTQSHQIIEDYLTNNFSIEEFDLLPIVHFHNLKSYLENISEVVCIEQRMYSDKLRVAGTSDLSQNTMVGYLSLITKQNANLKLMSTCMSIIYRQHVMHKCSKKLRGKKSIKW